MKTPQPRAIQNRRTNQAGVVLLEVLVALLIFSFGILGLVGLQTASVRNISESQYRVEAALWAETLIAQMRIADPLTRSSNFATGGGTTTTGYTAWKNLVTSSAGGLPGAAANAPTVTIAGNAVAITISWRAPSDSATHQYITATQLD